MALFILSNRHGFIYFVQPTWLFLFCPADMALFILSSRHGSIYFVQSTWLYLFCPTDMGVGDGAAKSHKK